MARDHHKTQIAVLFVAGFMILGACIGGVAAEALDNQTQFAGMYAGIRVVAVNKAGRETTKVPRGQTAQRMQEFLDRLRLQAQPVRQQPKGGRSPVFSGHESASSTGGRVAAPSPSRSLGTPGVSDLSLKARP